MLASVSRVLYFTITDLFSQTMQSLKKTESLDTFFVFYSRLRLWIRLCPTAGMSMLFFIWPMGSALIAQDVTHRKTNTLCSRENKRH